jgi:hypothetical protein
MTTINELIKKYEEEINKMYGVSTVIEKNDLLDLIVGSDIDVKDKR